MIKTHKKISFSQIRFLQNSKLFFKKKIKDNNTIDKYKARLS